MMGELWRQRPLLQYILTKGRGLAAKRQARTVARYVNIYYSC